MTDNNLIDYYKSTFRYYCGIVRPHAYKVNWKFATYEAMLRVIAVIEEDEYQASKFMSTRQQWAQIGMYSLISFLYYSLTAIDFIFSLQSRPAGKEEEIGTDIEI